MMKWIATLAIAAVAYLPTNAGQTIPTTTSTTNDLTTAPYTLEEGDEYMPSLSELLGGPVDNLPTLDGSEELQSDLIDFAKQFIGTRYRSGAKGPKAFDCSGFTSYVFRNFDMSLASSSRGQATQGDRVSIADARPGDLMFFSGSRAGRSIGHVGIVVSNEGGKVKFIHAATSKGVSIDTYPDGGYYSKRFSHVQRVLPS